MSKYEYVNQPKHYQGEGMSVIEVIQAYRLNFELGNVIKYVLRAGKKPDEDVMRELYKALWYLQAEIDRRRRDDVIEANREAADLNGLAVRESGGEWGAVRVPEREGLDAVLNPERDD